VLGSRPFDRRWRVGVLTVALVAGLALAWLALGDARPGSSTLHAPAAPPPTQVSVGSAAPDLLAPFTPVLDAVVATLTRSARSGSASVAVEPCGARDDAAIVAPSAAGPSLALVHRSAGAALASPYEVVRHPRATTQARC
jgi:hypothetical protein